MTSVGLIYPWDRADGTPLEVVYSHTPDGIEIQTAKDACGFVELSDAEREACTLDIEAEQALTD